MIDPVITFDKEAVNEILFCFDKSIDDEGYVTDTDNHRVLAIDDKEIKASNIGGIVDGKFFRNDIGSLIEVMDMRKNKHGNGD